MPIKKTDYPANWDTEIVPAVRHRAGERREGRKITVEARCEWCLVPNHTWVIRFDKPRSHRLIQYAGTSKTVPLMDYLEAAPKSAGATYIVLTTSHLDRDRTNNELGNLASLCQRCHLNHDRVAQHIPNRAYGRYHSRQPKLF